MFVSQLLIGVVCRHSFLDGSSNLGNTWRRFFFSDNSFFLLLSFFFFTFSWCMRGVSAVQEQVHGNTAGGEHAFRGGADATTSRHCLGPGNPPGTYARFCCFFLPVFFFKFFFFVICILEEIRSY